MNAPNSQILLIDDDSELLLSLSRTLKEYIPNIPIHAAGNRDIAISICKTHKIHLAVVDLELDKAQGTESGFSLITTLLENDPHLRIIVLTGHKGIEYGIEAIKRGAVSFQEKPIKVSDLAVLIKDFLQQRFLSEQISQQSIARSETILEQLVTSSPQGSRLKNELLFSSTTNQAVFLSGESGVGKSLCASLIHKMSPRSEKKFIRYQPSFVSADLVNSDLFGHKKGSFTGADTDRRGLLSEVEGGTLFIDEIDALPIETQVLLLGVLQEKKFRPLGSNQEVHTEFRLVTASNATIDNAIKDQKVRKDFYFRIAHHTITIPPLRERISEIPALVQQFLSAGIERKDFSVCRIDAKAILKLKNYRWIGNIRELQAVVEGAAYRAQFHSRFEILEEDIVLRDDEGVVGTFEEPDGGSFQEKILFYKKKLIRDALEQNGGNQVKAAKVLGLDRSTMRRIIADEL
jgi:DNA-binding NtrC family response regulator